MAAIEHYVARFLLRNVCTGRKPQIWAYDKSTGKSFQTNIKNVAGERDFYEAEIGGRVLSLEEGLSDLETKAAVIIDRIIAARSTGGLSVDTYGHLIPGANRAAVDGLDDATPHPSAIVTRAKSTDLNDVIPPIRQKTIAREFSNLYGAGRSGTGIEAAYPLRIIAPGFEVRTVQAITPTRCSFQFTDKNVLKNVR